MGLEIFNSPLSATGLNKNIQLNRYGGKILFRGSEIQDSYNSQSSLRLFDEVEIRKMISQNKNVAKILAENNIPIKLNMEELKQLMENHCKDVIKNSVGIAQNLPPALKNRVNMKDLKDGALLHDFGKVLIPAQVLNKSSSLTDDERKIMDLHSQLGFELLKNSGVNDNVLNLVRYHHSNTKHSKTFVPDINLQILNLADKYSALTESRVYKEKYTPQQALTILAKEVNDGQIHPFLFQALVKSVNNNGVLDNVTKC